MPNWCVPPPPPPLRNILCPRSPLRSGVYVLLLTSSPLNVNDDNPAEYKNDGCSKLRKKLTLSAILLSLSLQLSLTHTHTQNFRSLSRLDVPSMCTLSLCTVDKGKRERPSCTRLVRTRITETFYSRPILHHTRVKEILNLNSQHFYKLLIRSNVSFEMCYQSKTVASL